MNRRGHIGTFMLPIIALVLVVNALFVMVSFNDGIKNIKSDISILNGKSSSSHELVLHNLNKSISESIKKADKEDFEKTFNESLKLAISAYRNNEQNTNLYAKIALGNYTLNFVDGKYELFAYDIFENYENAYNEMKYSYSVHVLFDKTKVIFMKESL